MAAGKKLPLRKCVGCGEMKEKKELVRILRTQEGEVIVDLTGRANGRGAYICPQKSCLESAVKSRGLERSLRTRITDEIYTLLNEQIEGAEHGMH